MYIGGLASNARYSRLLLDLFRLTGSAAEYSTRVMINDITSSGFIRVGLLVLGVVMAIRMIYIL